MRCCASPPIRACRRAGPASRAQKQPHRRRWIKTRREMSELFAGPARSHGQHAGRGAALRSGAPKRKPILPSLAGDIEGEAQMLRDDARPQGWKRGWRCRDRRRSSAQPYFDRLEFRAGHHHPDGLSRLLPDRCRLHQVGQGRTTFRWGRGAARARARGRLGADHHRSRSARNWACCSNASSTPNACRCRTSISTSAKRGAAR
jgi:hypothetical protein